MIDIIKSTFESEAFLKTHISPRKRFFNSQRRTPSTSQSSAVREESQQPENRSVNTTLSEFEVPGQDRVFGEMYETNQWIGLQEKINKLPPGEEGPLQNVIAALQLYSDATLVAAFGGKTAWPVYLQLGNQSKYMRTQPNLSTTQQIAFIPKLPDELQDFYREHYGEPASEQVLALCKRELVHQLWLKLFDEEFVKVYKQGVVVWCYDGIRRRIFPCIFTYAADYPEK